MRAAPPALEPCRNLDMAIAPEMIDRSARGLTDSGPGTFGEGGDVVLHPVGSPARTVRAINDASTYNMPVFWSFVNARVDWQPKSQLKRSQQRGIHYFPKVLSGRIAHTSLRPTTCTGDSYADLTVQRM